jgi:hypothetical protein
MITKHWYWYQRESILKRSIRVKMVPASGGVKMAQSWKNTLLFPAFTEMRG